MVRIILLEANRIVIPVLGGMAEGNSSVRMLVVVGTPSKEAMHSKRSLANVMLHNIPVTLVIRREIYGVLR